MAKGKNGVNKSEAIRELLRANSDLTTLEIVTTLAEQGIDVTKGLIYLIRTKMKATNRRQSRKKAADNFASHDPVALIKKVKSLAADAGGLKKLKELLDIMSA